MKTKLTWFDRMMMAATFAEADAAEIGREYLTEKQKLGKSAKGQRRTSDKSVYAEKR